MSITSSMYTGAAGLSSHSDAMGVISDNIANVNTVGFRSSRANFSDVLGGMLSGSHIGAGSMIGSVQTMFAEGALLGTGNATDLAIRGDGFFVVSGTLDGITTDYYTRAGQFQVDPDGFMVTANGLRLQGYGLDPQGNLQTTPGDLQLDTSALPPSATTSLGLDANLDAGQAVDPTPFDITDPASTSDWSTSVTTYDSLGTPHQVTLFFKKMQDAPTPQWDVHVAAAGSDVDPAVAQDYTELGVSTLDFDTTGALTSTSLASVNVQWAGAAPATIDLDFGTPTSAGGTGVDGLTGYAGASAATSISQDGSSTGELSEFNIQPDGTIEARYSNGQSRSLGQIVTARFVSNEGLERHGDSLFAATGRSREPVLGVPGTRGHGAISSGSLEASNVDLAREFVTMIAVQRGFQSNSRTISTADEMLTDIVALKR